MSDFQQERSALVAECRELLEVVAQRPGCLKLLEAVRQQLQMFSRYKEGRSRRFSDDGTR